MKIWELDENISEYEDLTLENGSDDEWLSLGDMFRGKMLKNNWQPLKLKLIERDGSLKRGDIPYFSPGIPVFSKRAVTVLIPLIANNVEILDIECDIGDYKIINVINLVDGLDYKKSEISMYRDSDRIKVINKYAFHLNAIKEQNIFKIVERSRGPVFVSDEFRNKVMECGLEGFRFIEVWDSNE